MKFSHAEARQFTERCLLDGAEVRKQVAIQCLDKIIAAADLLVSAFTAGNKLLLCGNGGSAADCQHMAAEFVSRLSKEFERPAMPALALTTDTSFLTAFANDCGFLGVFARQIEALGKPGDVLIGFSTSGNSENILQAVDVAKQRGLKTIVLTGQGGKLPALADVAICIPHTSTQYIQECHLAVEHILCSIVERAVYA